MKFTLQYPMPHPPSPAFLEPATILRVATAAEQAGFSAIAFTEHPAPSHKWLTAGGHESFDPLVALSFCAAVTDRLRLMPFLMVLPYHQPFLAAKSAASLDVLSAGRLTLIAGTGYLRSEFAALGVDFDRRNELLESSIAAMRAVWTTSELDFDGDAFTARGVTARPAPVQPAGPPIWLGGNSRATRQRVALLADGWSPNQYDRQLARTTRTAALGTTAELAAGITEIAELREAAGRSPKCDVQVLGPHGHRIPAAADRSQHLDTLAALAAVGVTWSVQNIPHDDVSKTVDAIAAYGADVIGKLDA